MNSFIPNNIISKLLETEGSTYVNDPNDSGGPTKYGWTLKSYKNIYPNATIEDIKNLSESDAIDLYTKYWWRKYGCQYINSEDLAGYLFLSQINLGFYKPNKLLQQLCNEFGDYNLFLDGLLGEKSINAINNCSYVENAFPYILFHDIYMPIINNGKQMYKKGWRNRVLIYTRENK